MTLFCKPDAKIVEEIQAEQDSLDDNLDELGRRRWAATEAIAVGRGSIIAVASATGLSDRVFRNSIVEIWSTSQQSANVGLVAVEREQNTTN